MSRYPIPIVFAVGLVLTAEAPAWGPDGHRIVAEIAQRHLQPRARNEALRLLAIVGDGSLADVSSWADAIRDHPDHIELAKLTRPMHYLRFADASCRFDAAQSCANGACVVGGIERYAPILGDLSRTDAERAEALRFVVHFVGDVHQPLHAGYRSDRGGFSYQIQVDGKGTSMHGVWDYEIISSRRLDWREYARQLDTPLDDLDIGTPREWAEQSCRITRDGRIYPEGHAIGTPYLDAMRPTVERRLREAAMRLTDVLDRALAN